MPIFLGSSRLNGLLGSANQNNGSTAFSTPSPPISGAAIALNANLYNGTGSGWTNYNGVVEVVNFPLVGQLSNGFWQFNGTSDDLILTNGLYPNGLINSSSNEQSFTMMFYGTVGDLSSRRALLGNSSYLSTPSGSDAIFRTDTSPAPGYCHLDLRRGPSGTPTAVNTFSIPYSSGSIMNFAITYDGINTSASLYVDGVLTATSGAFNGLKYTPWYFNSGNGPRFGNNNNVDAALFNGSLGAFYVYNRILTGTEISQSALWFTQGNVTSSISAGGIQDISTAYLGSDLVYTKATTTTTTTTTTTSTTTTTTTTIPPSLIASGAVIAIDKNGWTNTGSIWNNVSGGISVVGAPLVGQAPNGFWQFDGTNDYITASRALISGSGTLPFQQGGAQNQDWTVLFYGTIGSLTTRRAFMGNPKYNQQTGAPFSGSDILFRTDDPAGLPADKFSVNVRTGRSLGVNGSQAYTITGSYVSGAITNMALVWDNPTLSLYQNGVLVSSYASSSWNGPSIFYNAAAGFDTRIFSNANTDASPFNGTLGAFYAYNRALSVTEISQSAVYFTQNL
jgi:hypothetical protein